MVEVRRPIRDKADIEALEREMPLEERIPYRSTYEVIAAAASRDPAHPAIHFLPAGRAADPPVTITYGQFFARVNQTANLFHDLGIRPGRAVSYLLPNLPQTHFVIWGGEAAGIVNAINPLLSPEQIADIMIAAESTVLVALGPVPGSDIWDKVQAVRRLVPQLDAVLQVGGPGDERDGVLGFDTQLDRYPADRLVSGRQIAADDIAAYFHTGGTTGAPKLARHTHWGEVYEAWTIQYLADFTPRDVVMLGLPMFHVNAVIATGLGPFYGGAETVLLSPAGYRNSNVIGEFWRIVERYRATTFSAVPTIYAALLNVPVGEADVSSLRFAICGAAPMPVEVFRAFEAHSGVKILEGYGLTEGTCASSFNPRDGKPRIGSVGLRFPYQAMKAVRLDIEGRHAGDCAVDEIGVIAISGPNVFPGYRQESYNGTAFVAPGWLNTGDLGRQDADGFFWLTGRAKDLIIRGGHNIDPAVIEEALHRHPAVALAAAVGRPDTYAGEIPVAYVALKPGAAATPEELQAFAREHIAERAAAPAEVVVMESLPLTAIGKIFKPTLRYDAASRVYRRALAEAGLSAVVEVGPHPAHGTVATVRPEQSAAGRSDLEARVATCLGGFAVHYQLDWPD